MGLFKTLRCFLIFTALQIQLQRTEIQTPLRRFYQSNTTEQLNAPPFIRIFPVLLCANWEKHRHISEESESFFKDKLCESIFFLTFAPANKDGSVAQLDRATAF